MKQQISTRAYLSACACETRANTGLPHWYAMLNPLQDDGFGGTVCAKEEVNPFIYSFVYEGIACGVPYYATGHA